MSKAVVATGYGGPEVLSLVDAEPPAPGQGEVQLEVRAAGVNPIDVKRYGGLFGRDPERLPLRLGYEASGVVRAAGPGAVGPTGPVRVGDEVIAFRADGAYAERITVPASAVIPKPSGLGWAEAAGLMLTGVTAAHAVSAVGLRAGETVVVHAAAGGVGLMAVQLARIAGARVVGTASPGRHDLLRAFGVHPVAYGPGLAERIRTAAPEGVDAAIDAVGTDEALEVSVALVGDRDRVATIAGFGRGAELGIRVLGGGPGADPGEEIRDAARSWLARLAGEGRLRVLVSSTHPLTEVAEAHRSLLTGHTAGKTVLVP
jgi:NADPH:quinone reductase-like Zn-dependent oxidoreductase